MAVKNRKLVVKGLSWPELNLVANTNRLSLPHLLCGPAGGYRLSFLDGDGVRSLPAVIRINQYGLHDDQTTASFLALRTENWETLDNQVAFGYLAAELVFPFRYHHLLHAWRPASPARKVAAPLPFHSVPRPVVPISISHGPISCRHSTLPNLALARLDDFLADEPFFFDDDAGRRRMLRR